MDLLQPIHEQRQPNLLVNTPQSPNAQHVFYEVWGLHEQLIIGVVGSKDKLIKTDDNNMTVAYYWVIKDTFFCVCWEIKTNVSGHGDSDGSIHGNDRIVNEI